MTHRRPIPKPTLRRLPAYLRLARKLQHQGREVVSTSRIAEELNLESTQVRKDLGAAGASGRPRVGYDVAGLIDAIERCLGWLDTSDAFLVGAGHLGRALLGDRGLATHGLHIVCAFDEDGRKTGTSYKGRDILPMAKLVDLGQRMHVNIGILTVPGDAAQRAAEQLVLAGVRAIWNFTPTPLDLPEEIIVVDVDLYASLAVLSQRLEQRIRPLRPQEEE